MSRFRYDRDLDCLIEIRSDSNFFEPSKSPTIISDIEPYRAVASDIACDGKRPLIGGRRQHREFLSRNGYVEVGNERNGFRSDNPSEREMQRDRVEDIKRATGEHGSNTGADEARHYQQKRTNWDKSLRQLYDAHMRRNSNAR
jgi:hypothetical protein